MKSAKKLWDNRGLFFLFPFTACVVTLVRLADGRQTTWDLDWAAFACLFMAAKMLELVIDRTAYGKPVSKPPCAGGDPVLSP